MFLIVLILNITPILIMGDILNRYQNASSRYNNGYFYKMQPIYKICKKFWKPFPSSERGTEGSERGAWGNQRTTHSNSYPKHSPCSERGTKGSERITLGDQY